MKKSASLLIFLHFCISLSAQHTVSGIVSDKQDDTRLLDNVSVYIPEFNRYDVTKDGGTYILRNVGIGRVTIQFTRVGYKPVVKSISTTDSATVLNVQMEPAVEELQQVSISADRIRSTSPLPWSTTSFSPADFQVSGSVHAMGVLASQPGIDRITQGNGIQRPVVRGQSGSDIVSYQFGVRVDNQSWDEYQDLELNDASNTAVEVVKGPATLLYGPNSSGGALIWKDRLPPVAGHVDGKVDLGFHTNTKGFETGLHVNGAGKKGVFYGVDIVGRMHASYVQGDSDVVDKNVVDKNFAANSKFNSTSARGMIGWGTKSGVSKLTLAHLRQELGIIEFEDRSQLDAEEFTREQRDYGVEAPAVKVNSSILSYQHTLLIGQGSLQVNLSGQSSDRSESEPDSTGPFERVAMAMTTYTADARYVSDPSKSRGWTVGLQGMGQQNKNSGRDTVVADSKTSDVGAYALGRFSLSRMDLLFGGRFDQRSIAFDDRLSFRSPSFSAGLRWYPVSDLTLRFNAASGFSAPNSYQLTADGKKEGGYRYEIGDKELKATRNMQADVSVAFEKPSFRLSLSAYGNRISDDIYLAPTGAQSSDTLPVYEFRQSDAAINGFEAGLDIHPAEVSWLDFSVNYAMIRGELSDGLGYLPSQPADKLVASITFSKDRMEGMYRPYLRFTGSSFAAMNRVADYESPTEGYFLLDVHLGGSIKIGQQFMDISFSGTNLLNTGYYNHLSLIPRDLRIFEMGRNICIRLAIPFGIVNPDRPKAATEAAPSGS